MTNKDKVDIETSQTSEGRTRDDLSKENQDTENKRPDSSVRKFPLSKNKPVNFMDVRVEGAVTGSDDELELSVKSVHVDSFNDCLKILENLNLMDCFDESE